MKIVFKDIDRDRFLPFSYTRPLSQMRVGITTLEEKWTRLFEAEVFWDTEDYLSAKFPNTNDADLIVNALYVPTEDLYEAVEELSSGEALYNGDDFIVSKGKEQERKQFQGEVLSINHKWEIFQKNGACIKFDFAVMTEDQMSHPLGQHVNVIGDGEVFVEEGAKVNGAFFNTSGGPIYIGKNAEVMEGSVIRGPFALGEGATIKMSAKIYGDTTIGPHCKVGGEVSNSVIFAYSNKGHDGFIGNSVIGEWCNLGADTNSSNLKNNYGNVKVWSYQKEELENTGLQFCGLLMGDHSKTGINTMLNTGTVVGVCANIFGAAFPEKFIPSFSWGGAEGFVEFKTEKAVEVADRMMQRRSVEFTTDDQAIFDEIKNRSQKFRS